MKIFICTSQKKNTKTLDFAKIPIDFLLLITTTKIIYFIKFLATDDCKL